jgi:hypothetical protein
MAARPRSVPSKSFPMVCLTGHVWHPMGKPSGVAASFGAKRAEPAAARPAMVNCLLDMFFTGGSISIFDGPRRGVPALNLAFAAVAVVTLALGVGANTRFSAW